jgi:hypothetical protein
MDKQEAKLLLQSYRPRGQDASDPALAEALELARRDPELGEWLNRQCELDESISRRLRQATVPADLRQAIVAGQRSQRRVNHPATPWFKSPALAWAAAIVLLFVAAFVFRDDAGAEVTLATYRDAMTANLRSGFDFDRSDPEPAHLRQWLARENNLRGFEIPTGLTRSIGCKVFEFENLKPALICFTLPDQEVVHLFVVDGVAFQGEEFVPDTCATRCNDFNTLAWRGEQQVYLLVGRVDSRRLGELAGLREDQWMANISEQLR